MHIPSLRTEPKNPALKSLVKAGQNVSTTRISVGAQLGDRLADEATNAHILEIRQLLAGCEDDYSPEVDELAIVLRVDGELWHWNFEGIEKLRLAKKQRYVTVDIGVPVTRWQGDQDELRQYLADQTRVALTAMIERLSKAKIPFDADRFWKAVDPALHAFLTREVG